MIMLADRLADGADGQQTFGGIDMTVRRNAFGRQVDSFERDIDADRRSSDGASAARRVHPGAVGGADRRRRSRFWALTSGTGRIVAVRQGPLLATAFHPELTPDRRIHELFVDIVKDNT